ncbi:hypothetical protein HYH03_009541 [Edaphochlamys debaryana]|uniref:Uncharacterized protein n=1 Tax=Edaphochlamys debaryana TaxID=47281 RepID=A0A835XY29_9CHLO|nr:hypothetical protein HYH03_009541 [Edaphochlamys debaryana]|eukprot:KAG2492301.1 hypothetical protein HYH03_009541 [Edaphochlamys debaryana]
MGVLLQFVGGDGRELRALRAVCSDMRRAFDCARRELRVNHARKGLTEGAKAVIMRGAVSALDRGCRPLDVTLAVIDRHAQELLSAFACTSLQRSLPTTSLHLALKLLTPSTAPALACAFPALRRLCLFLPATASDRILPAAQALALLTGSGTGTGHDEQQPAEAGGQGLGGAESSAAPCGSAAAGGSAPGPAQSAVAAAGLEPLPSAAVTIPPLQPGRPGLAGLRELKLFSDGVIPPPLLAPLFGGLAGITQLELTEGLVSAVHVTSLQPLTQLRRLSLQAIELRVGGEPDGLTALSALTHLAVSAIAMREPPVDANWIDLNQEEQELDEMDRRQLPSCELPAQLEVLALGGCVDDGGERWDGLQLLSGLSGGPCLTRLDLSALSDYESCFYAFYITRLTSLQQLYTPKTTLVLDSGLSQLTALTQLVASDLQSTHELMPNPDGPGFVIHLHPCTLPPRLPCLTLTGKCGAWHPGRQDPGPPKLLGQVGLVTGTEHLTRLELLNDQGKFQIPAGPLAGLVGLKELDLPRADLLGPGSLAELTALTLLRVRRLVRPSPESAAGAAEAGPPPPAEEGAVFELPPNLQLLTVKYLADRYAPSMDDFILSGPPAPVRLTCAHGPARLHISGDWRQPLLSANLLLGLAGLRELEAPCARLCLGPAGLSAHTSLTAINVYALVLSEESLEGAGAACGAPLLPPRLQKLMLRDRLSMEELAALGRAPEGLRSPLCAGLRLVERGHVASSGELLPAAQDTVCRAARFLAAVAEPPTQFSIELGSPQVRSPDDEYMTSPVWHLLPVGSMAASAAGGAGGNEGSVPPSHAPWLAALGGMPLRRLSLWSVALSPRDLRALASHMTQLQVLTLSVSDLRDLSSLPLLGGLRQLQELQLDSPALDETESPSYCPHCKEYGSRAVPPGAAEALLGLCVAAPDTLRRVRLNFFGCKRSQPAFGLRALVRVLQPQLEAGGRSGVELLVGAPRGLTPLDFGF